MVNSNRGQDEDIRHRLAEIMSAAGVGYNAISLEILYMLPREFVDRYQELWEMALGPLVRAPGQTWARDAEVGVSQTKTARKGQVLGAGAGGIGKKLARSFGLRNEAAFRTKERIDKRLRGLARELRLELGDIEARTAGGTRAITDTGGKTGAQTRARGNTIKSTRQERRCRLCGRIASLTWNFCPFDGKGLIECGPEEIREIKKKR